MIVQRQEKDSIIRALYESSNILGSKYGRETKELVVYFSNGSVYQYPDVSGPDYLQFESADSQGSVFNAIIRKKPFTKLDNLTPTTLDELKGRVITESKNDKSNRLKDVCNTLSTYMTTWSGYTPEEFINYSNMIKIKTNELLDLLVELNSK